MRILWLLTVCILLVGKVHAQAQDLKVILAMNQGDSINQIWLARQLYNLKIALPDAQVEVVCYGYGLRTLIGETSRIQEDIAKLQDKGVVFAACENSMSSAHVTLTNLVPRCTTVRAGIAHVVLRQAAGWQYVDATR
jgi:intracellular sulfur oxidation DsrE/DsrF family protein